MKPIVLDNSVLTDVILESEDKSANAFKVYTKINSSMTEIYLPYFALFEIKTALTNKKLIDGKINLRKWFTKNNPLKCKYFPIDSNFVTKNINSGIGYLKAADYIYVCLAKQENAILITEDKKQYKVSKNAGIETYTLEEFLKES